MVFATPTDWWLQRPTVISKTAAYTALSTDSVVLVDASGGAVTITLPPSGGVPGKTFVVKKTDTSTNAVTIATAGGETIDAQTDLTILVPYRSIAFVAHPTGLGWWLVGGQSVVHRYNFGGTAWAAGSSGGIF